MFCSPEEYPGRPVHTLLLGQRGHVLPLLRWIMLEPGGNTIESNHVTHYKSIDPTCTGPSRTMYLLGLPCWSFPHSLVATAMTSESTDISVSASRSLLRTFSHGHC